MKKLRLLVTKKCHRNCPLCVNKQWDLNKLPTWEVISPYEEIVITGGEPLLFPTKLKLLLQEIRYLSNWVKLFLYTTKTDGLLDVLPLVNGVTLTLHEQRDVEPFIRLNKELLDSRLHIGKSLRLKVFDGIVLPEGEDFKVWNIVPTEWLEDCPLPEEEEFRRLNYLW